MAKRKAISKKVRFEVFKRDSFICQYCGKSAPEIILNLDHIKPVAKGGDNSIMNLVTSCFDCNSGKSDRELSDNSVLSKQKKQLDELNDKREQLEMMIRWRESIDDIASDTVDALSKRWDGLLCGHYSISDIGKKTIKRLIKKHSFIEICDAMDKSTEQYLVDCEDDGFTPESVSKSFNKIAGILRNKNRPDHIQKLYYIRGILRNRIRNITEYQVIKVMTDAYEKGVSIEYLTESAKNANSQSDFFEFIDCLLEAIEDGQI